MRIASAMVILAATVVIGCTRDRPQAARELPEPPSNGSGRYTDGDGQARTAFQPIAYLNYGESDVRDLGQTPGFVGYEFEARAEDTPRLVLEGAGRLQLTLYGPRGETGLWDKALATDAGHKRAVIESTVQTGGIYFALVQGATMDGVFKISLSCVDCEPPACPDVAPCDLVCEGGYTFDDEGCRACACAQTGCVPEDCDEGEACQGGECVPTCECPGDLQAVCGDDRVTYGNRCRAECAGAAVVGEGRCPEINCREAGCEDGEACVDGRCVSACECPSELVPVCGLSGATYSNACQARCARDRVEYGGRCIQNRCEGPGDCGDDEICVAALRVPENQRRCRGEVEGPCITECMPMPRGRPCMDDGGRGGHGACPGGMVCAFLSGAAERGICLASCEIRGGEGECQPSSRCAPDSRGELVCRERCPCEDTGEPVCAEGREFLSACHARECAGVFRFSSGPCEAD